MKNSVEKEAPYFLDVDFLHSWVHGKSKHTKRAYLRVGSELLTSLGPSQLAGASLSFLQAFIECNSGRSQETKRQRSAIVKSLFSFGVRTGYLKASPAVFLPQIKSKSKLTERYLTEEEVMRMITLTENLRDQTILKVLYSGGLRVSELTGLNWGDLQERAGESGQIKVKGKGDKERVVVLSSQAFSQLLKLRPDEFQTSAPVFLSREGKGGGFRSGRWSFWSIKPGSGPGLLKRSPPTGSVTGMRLTLWIGGLRSIWCNQPWVTKA